MAKVILPTNPYISEFDYAVVFDLVTGKIKFSLSPSSIQQAAGIIGVKVEAISPTGSTISPGGYAFTPANIGGTFEFNLPRVGGAFIWGPYKTKLTLDLPGGSYVSEKDPFNLCAPDSNMFATEGRAKMDITVNCKTGKALISGLTNLVYNGKTPTTEIKNVTYYHPSESELPPQKGISNLPFEVTARQGRNSAKGSVIGSYDFPDRITVVVKFTASIEKEIKCNANMDALYTAYKKYYENYSACKGSKFQDCCTLAELAALLVLIMMGTADGKDVSDLITTVEKILDVDCRCGTCDGDPIVPQPNVCEPVRDLHASIAQFALSISFSTGGLPIGSELLIEYRLKSSAPGGLWGQLVPRPLTNGQVQNYTITVATIAQYEVRVTVLCPVGQSSPVQVDTNIPTVSNCVEIGGISGTVGTGTPPTTAAPATTILVPPTTNSNVNPGGLLAFTDYDPYTALQQADSLSYTHNSVFSADAQPKLTFQLAQVGNVVPQGKHLVIKVAMDKTLGSYFNTQFMQGTFPDQTFYEGLISNGSKYYISRVPVWYDPSAPLVITSA